MMKLCFFLLFTPVKLPSVVLGVILFLSGMFLMFPQTSLIISPQEDFFSWSLVVLTVWLVWVMLSANLTAKKFFFLSNLVKVLMIFLIFSFFSENFFGYYFFFEAVLIPIFWIILGWGYQPERILASVMMFFYTMTSSLPLLVVLFLSWGHSMSFFMGGTMFESPSSVPSWVMICFVMAFLVKFPMYLVHLWLPKAHVEAPVLGSMILAGVLLKLGGYGLFRYFDFFFYSEVAVFFFVSVWGGSLLSVLCCRLTDMKVIIAYSSVVHMALVIVGIFSAEGMSVSGIWWVMVAHGLVSSGMFAAANMMYEQSHSRSLLINKGVLLCSPLFALMWFLLVMMNFSGPFTLNLFGEVGLIISALSVTPVMMIGVGFLTFFSAAYGLILYASSQHGSLNFTRRIYISLSMREVVLLWGHMWPIFILLLSLSFFFLSQSQ